MKKIINRKMYNTETAEKIGGYSTPGVGTNDFNYMEENLYKTKKGTFFIHGEGGALSKYAEHFNNSSTWGEDIRVIGKNEALEFLEYYNLVEEFEKVLGENIEEG